MILNLSLQCFSLIHFMYILVSKNNSANAVYHFILFFIFFKIAFGFVFGEVLSFIMQNRSVNLITRYVIFNVRANSPILGLYTEALYTCSGFCQGAHLGHLNKNKAVRCCEGYECGRQKICPRGVYNLCFGGDNI